MDGVRRNVARLFGAGGKLFLLAMDHAQSGVVGGLEKPAVLMESLADSALDGFILNIGLADRMAAAPFLRKKLVLRTSFGGTSLSSAYADAHRNHVSPETALAVGADAVLMMLCMGGADYANIQEAAADIDAYHALGIPVVAEILASDFGRTATFDVQYHGARVAAELGADVVKAFYVEGFEKVVAACPAPVILAGGPRDQDIVTVARRALSQGARGFAFGRNIFQDADPAALVARIAAVMV